MPRREELKSATRVPICTGFAVCFWRLWVLRRPKLRHRSAEFHLGEKKARRILNLLRERELIEVSVEKRSRTRALERYRKLAKPFADNAPEAI
jgi:hypothetical protein